MHIIDWLIMILPLVICAGMPFILVDMCADYTPWKNSSVRKPSTKILLGDTWRYAGTKAWGVINGTTDPTGLDVIHDLHSGSANIVWGDGHYAPIKNALFVTNIGMVGQATSVEYYYRITNFYGL